MTPEKAVGSIEHRVILSNGEVRWQEWSDRIIFDDNGDIVECLAVGRDITSRKEIQELNIKAFHQIERNIQQFAILNDQIRNPLTILMVLMDDLEKENVLMMEEQITRIDQIVDQLDKGLIESEKVQSFLRKHCPL